MTAIVEKLSGLNKKLATPSKIYLVLVFIALIMNFFHLTWKHILFIIIFAIVWTYIIQYNHHKYNAAASYIGAILPFAVMYFVKSFGGNSASTTTTAASK